MSEAYQRLVQTGFIGSVKRDVLFEAHRDLYYLGSIPQLFWSAGEAARENPEECAIQLIEDLTGKGWCVVARFSTEKQGGHEILECDRAQLEELLEAAKETPWNAFLVSTDSGDEWVRRYKELVAELS